MIKFQITYKSSFCYQWPKIKIYNNGNFIKEVECNNEKFEFTFVPAEKNNLVLDWFNKSEKHTKIQNGKIVEDQSIEILNLRIDDIQVESWMLTDTHYEPRYFRGFIKQHQDKNIVLETKLKSQLIWHFPGKFVFQEFPQNFWDFYFQKKQDKEVINFLDKDPDRIHKFRGSLDPCLDIVLQLKKLI